jgi:crotonobetainyl-CoA:carnitine CoA-transferase CaiB-like acyl-CoA transferase
MPTVRKLREDLPQSHAPELRRPTETWMSWNAIAAVAELLGAAGVIASLVYLASQVRSSGYQARQAAIQSVVNKMNDVWNTMAAANTAAFGPEGRKGWLTSRESPRVSSSRP